jgi:uncharacterized protein YbcC (UPF0753/DUF2309 family)
MSNESIINKIQTASKVIGKTWPLYSFVTSNPLAGYEHTHFKKAVQDAGRLVGGNLLPDASNFRQAWQQGEIDKTELVTLLDKEGLRESPEFYLEKMDSIKSKDLGTNHPELDRMMVKWLMSFMDEGLAEWEMPFKEDGFYNAWRILVTYDTEIKVLSLSDIPKTSIEALTQLLENYSEQEQIQIMEYHLAALPGWTGYIKYRAETNTIWHQNYSITLPDYLAVRLLLATYINVKILPEISNEKPLDEEAELQYLWLQSWEKNWQNNLVNNLKDQKNIGIENYEVTDAQLVFCIDTRSELIRRNVETKGNYETFGFAGFFGIAMDYENLNDGISRKSCPPIVPSAYQVSETAQENKSEQFGKYLAKSEKIKFINYFSKRMKNMLPSAFGYVEGSGVFYGVSLLARTLIPGALYNPKRKNDQTYEHNCNPAINYNDINKTDSTGISLEEKTAIVKSAFNVMGWTKFAPLVIIVGHGSHSANNPFGSSLDCGACAASPGRHNARMLAKLANLPEVRNNLYLNHQLNIPDNTIFVGAEHNTTTDEIVLFDSEFIDSHEEQLNKLKKDLRKAQETATHERLGKASKSIAAAHKKTNNWSETRPEWGLAKNAGFVIGPRSLTKNLNLNGNCFMNSYKWENDADGSSLEAIMQGPMVVTQWINSHYYFATVDNDKFGGGSKINHNITGKFGVVQGNGGDLKFGIPLQSVNESDDQIYHKPLRLSVLIEAPKERITKILNENENLKSLLDNEWIYLLVMDPTKNNSIERYQEGNEWISATSQLDLLVSN